jgi:hypothetical protein
MRLIGLAVIFTLILSSAARRSGAAPGEGAPGGLHIAGLLFRPVSTAPL